MNWGDWYNSPNYFSLQTNQKLTFSKALNEMKTKNKILPDSFIYFIDFKQIVNFHSAIQEFKTQFAGLIENNCFDDEIGCFLSFIE